MDTPAAVVVPSDSSAPTTLSPIARAAAVFARPARAWVGLEQRAQWWLPFLVTLVVQFLLMAALYQRAYYPMMLDQWETAAERGQMDAAHLEKVQESMSGPVGILLTGIPGILFLAITFFVLALVVWFGVGFVLGSKMSYRRALEVVCWSSLVWIPGQVVMHILAWFKESMKVHSGFGVLVPMGDDPSKLQVGLAFFLDALGPLAIWPVAVAVVGAAALSGAPTKSVAWVLGGLYLALAIFGAAMGAIMTP